MTSVVERADRPVPQRPASLVVALVLLAITAVAKPITDHVYATANRAPTALAWLRAHQDPPPALTPPRRSAVILLIDGMRDDEARRMPAFSRLVRRGMRAVTVLRPPTFSIPFYHAMLTGVGPDGTGVRSNAFHGHARLDSLADRVRAAGRRCAFLAEGNGWMARMHARRGDRVDSQANALGAPLTRVLESLGHPDAPSLVVAHFLDVDTTAHQTGVHSPAHRAALRGAGRVIARVTRLLAGRDVVLAVLADHGHIDGGGHGGDEPVVTHAPFVLVGPGVPHLRLHRPFRVEEIAPTLAALMGVAPPRSAVAVAAPEVAPASATRSALAGFRAHRMVDAIDTDLARLDQSRFLLVSLWAFLALCGLGAVKRAFRGFGVETLLAPALYVGLIFFVQLVVFHRPLTVSAVDERTRQSVRLVGTGAVAALIALGVAAFVGRRMRRLGRAGVRRAAAATGLCATALGGFALAWIGGALGPWPLSAHAFYAPALYVGTMAGADAVCACALGLCAIRRRPRPITAATSGPPTTSEVR